MFYSIWWPKMPGETSDIPPAQVREQGRAAVPQDGVGGRATSGATRSTSSTRALAKIDAKPYMAHAEVGDAVLRGAADRTTGRHRMRLDLAELVAPGHTAVVTQECQGAIVGPDAGLAALADEARREALPNIARLLPGRAGRGSVRRALRGAAQARRPGLQPQRQDLRVRRGRASTSVPGSPGTELVPELDAAANRSRAAPVARHRADGRHRPRFDAAQPRRERPSSRSVSRSTWRSPTW